MSNLRRLLDEIYLDKVLIAIKWVGFFVCVILMIRIIIDGYLASDIYQSLLSDSEELARLPREKAVSNLNALYLSLQRQSISATIILIYLIFHMFYLRLAENARTR